MKFVAPTLGGILGAAQLSTACTIWRPSLGTDIGLTGTATPDFLWSVPLGAVSGASLCWAFLWLKGRPEAWQEWRSACLWSIVIGFLVAPMAPAFLGLSRQTAAQLWQGFTVLYSIAWFCICVTTQIERISKRVTQN